VKNRGSAEGAEQAEAEDLSPRSFWNATLDAERTAWQKMADKLITLIKAAPF